MGAFADADLEIPAVEVDGAGHVDESPKDIGRQAFLEARQVAREAAVEKTGHDAHEKIEVDAHHEGRGQGVYVEEVYEFGEFVFDPPATGVDGQRLGQRQKTVVGDDVSGFCAAVVFHDDLAKRIRAAFQAHLAFMG